jgi:hypothetical protein
VSLLKNWLYRRAQKRDNTGMKNSLAHLYRRLLKKELQNQKEGLGILGRTNAKATGIDQQDVEREGRAFCLGHRVHGGAKRRVGSSENREYLRLEC